MASRKEAKEAERINLEIARKSRKEDIRLAELREKDLEEQMQRQLDRALKNHATGEATVVDLSLIKREAEKQQGKGGTQLPSVTKGDFRIAAFKSVEATIQNMNANPRLAPIPPELQA